GRVRGDAVECVFDGRAVPGGAEVDLVEKGDHSGRRDVLSEQQASRHPTWMPGLAASRTAFQKHELISAETPRARGFRSLRGRPGNVRGRLRFFFSVWVSVVPSSLSTYLRQV